MYVTTLTIYKVSSNNIFIITVTYLKYIVTNIYSKCSPHLQMTDTLSFSIKGLLKLTTLLLWLTLFPSLRPLQVSDLLPVCRQNAVPLCHHPLAETDLPYFCHTDRLKNSLIQGNKPSSLSAPLAFSATRFTVLDNEPEPHTEIQAGCP